MTENAKKENKVTIKSKNSRYFIHVLIMGSILILLYFLLALVIMPFYTRQKQAIVVPDVENLSYGAAEKMLAFLKLRPVVAEIKYDEIFPAGFVVFQNPNATSIVKKGRRIYLTISKGKNEIKMPDLVGMAERDARFVLLREDIVLREVNYEFDILYPEGVVIDQSISPDEDINLGTPVDLEISLGEEPDDSYVPYLIGRTMEDIELDLKKSCLILGKVSFEENLDKSDQVVIFQSIEAGTQTAKGDTLNIVINKWPMIKREEIVW